MYPILFNYKIITIGSYGLLLGAAFYTSFLLCEREFKLKGINPELAYKLLIAVIPSAVIGAKLFHIFENLDEFMAAPSDMIFSGAGLSVYGGFVLSFILRSFHVSIFGLLNAFFVHLFISKRSISFLKSSMSLKSRKTQAKSK